jgi:hypothetical protein
MISVAHDFNDISQLLQLRRTPLTMRLGHASMP